MTFPSPCSCVPHSCKQFWVAGYRNIVPIVVQTVSILSQGRHCIDARLHVNVQAGRVWILCECCARLCGMHINCGVFRMHLCRVQDYWQGYKLFCYAYYSHSREHESEFRESKLGSCIPYKRWFLLLSFPIVNVVVLCLWVCPASVSVRSQCVCVFKLLFIATSMSCTRAYFPVQPQLWHYCRTTSVATSQPPTSTFASCAPHIMPAATPPDRNVLQVGARRRLQQPSRPNATFR